MLEIPLFAASRIREHFCLKSDFQQKRVLPNVKGREVRDQVNSERKGNASFMCFFGMVHCFIDAFYVSLNTINKASVCLDVCLSVRQI